MTSAELIAAAIANRAKRLGQVRALQPVKQAASERAAELRDQVDRAKKIGQRARFTRSMEWVPGFFPTPPALVTRMIEAAELEPGMACLEPSAGTGNIAKAILRAGISAHLLQCIEIVPKLAEALIIDGLATRCADFMEYEPGQLFDRILMNPPFENRQDEEHIRHAATFLRSGGRLVGICTVMTAARMAAWVNGRGWIEDLPPDAFVKSERSTGVRTSLVILNK